jgi:hypothetical protein
MDGELIRVGRMAINFERTMTEAEFKRPLLDATEEKMARDLLKEPDLSIDGLRGSLASWLVGLLGGSSR